MEKVLDLELVEKLKDQDLSEIKEINSDSSSNGPGSAERYSKSKSSHRASYEFQFNDEDKENAIISPALKKL